MAHRLLRDPDTDGWERSDFPIVCETCLGPNPFVRMQRVAFGGTCHISNRPYTVFRWRPGNDARYKKTIICQEVAKAKNVCQVCLLDLDTNLPVEVRDKALGLEKEEMPQSDVGKEYQLAQQEQQGIQDSSFSRERPNDLILKLARTTPYYKRNRAQICSFYVRGECTRGAECPYRHELPTSGDLAEQNIRDRYYGINDPVAKKMLRRAGEMTSLKPPDDETIQTLYVGGITPIIQEQDLREKFQQHGEITSIKKVDSRCCAFITYASRAQAEKAADSLHNKLILRGTRLKVMWGKPQQPKAESQDRPYAPEPSESSQPLLKPASIQRQQGEQQPIAPSGPNYFNLPVGGSSSKPCYPSMDPTAMGTRLPAPGEPKRQAESSQGLPAPKRQKQQDSQHQHHPMPPPLGGEMARPGVQQQARPPYMQQQYQRPMMPMPPSVPMQYARGPMAPPQPQARPPLPNANMPPPRG